MKIYLLGGTGALGGVIAARLALAGNQVKILKRNVSKSNHATNSDFLLIAEKEYKIRIPTVLSEEEINPPDWLIVTVKAPDTEVALVSVQHLIGKNTKLLTLQNGWGTAEIFSKFISTENFFQGVAYFNGVLLGMGVVQQLGNLVILETESGSYLEKLFSSAGFEVSCQTNIKNVIWQKLAVNACTLPLSALPKINAQTLGNQEDMLLLMPKIIHEVAEVASFLGIDLDVRERVETTRKLLLSLSEGKSSMLQDVLAKRKTEIDYVNGAVVKLGYQFGVTTPYNETLWRLVRAKESGYEV